MMNKKIVLKLSLMGLLLFPFAYSTAYANEKSETVAKAKADNGHVKGKRPPRTAHIFLSIARFENRSAAPGKIFDEIRTCIQQCLVGTMKFEVVERERLKTVLTERQLVASGIMDDLDSTVVKSDQKQSASYVIYGIVQSYNIDNSSVNAEGVARSTARSEIKLLVKLANAETGRVIAVKTVVGHGIDNMIAIDGCRSSAGHGIRDAIDEAGHAVADWLRDLVCPAKVLKVDKAEITIDMNENEVKEGDVFDVIEEGDVIIDPDGGAVLGYDSKNMGSVVITHTGLKTSKAKPIDYGEKLPLDKLDVSKHTYRLRRVGNAALKNRVYKKMRREKLFHDFGSHF